MVWGGANTWQPDTSRCNRGWRPVMLCEAVDMCCVASSVTCPTRDGDDRRWCSVTHSRYRRRHKGKVTVSRCARERARERECNLLILHLLQQWWPVSEAIGKGFYLTNSPCTLCEVHALTRNTRGGLVQPCLRCSIRTAHATSPSHTHSPRQAFPKLPVHIQGRVTHIPLQLPEAVGLR